MEDFKQIKTYEDALKVLGREDFCHENLYNREIARRKLEIIVEALNEGWKPDWGNASQLKWYAYFFPTIRSSLDITPSYSYTEDVGGHLCCKSKEIAKYVGTQFIDLYRETLLG